MSGKADYFQAKAKAEAQQFPLCPAPGTKPWPSLPKALELGACFGPLRAKAPQKRGPEDEPILVKCFTSTEATASQNQEQLKSESSQATGELSKINQKSSALALEVRLIMRADLLALLPLSFISQVR